MSSRRYENLADRLSANSTESEDGCRLWTGKLNREGGYPRYNVWCCETGKTKTVYAHRTAWEIANDVKIPEGFEIDHKCVNSRCIEPEHLELVTAAENIRRRDARRATAKLIERAAEKACAA